MTRNYLLVLLTFIGILISTTVSAQIVATDNTVTNFVNGISGQNNILTVLGNDTLNGASATLNNVNVLQISTTNGGVNIINGWLNVAPGTPAGTHVVVYQICQIGNSSNCDTATVTVNVCALPAPIIAPVSCSNTPTSLSLSGLPTGSWTLSVQYNFNTISTITGASESYILSGLSPGYYSIRVTDAGGCTSAYVNQDLGYFDGFDIVLNGTYFDANNDGIANLGDVIYYQFFITNTLNCPINNVTITENGANGSIATIASGATDSSYSMVYNLTQSDINNGQVNIWFAINGTSGGSQTYAKAFTTVELNVTDGFQLNPFIDVNNNGILDGSEEIANLGYFSVVLNDNTSNEASIYTNDGSHTIFESNPSNSYDVNYILNNYSCMGQYTVGTSAMTNITVPSGSGITVINIPITIMPCTDVGIIISSSGPRPGFTYSAHIYYANYGNQAIASGTVTFVNDPLTPILSVSESGITSNATGFTYNFTDLQPGEFGEILVMMQVPTTLNIGDQVINSASISLSPNDLNAENNNTESIRTVSNSFDPNDKAENHDGKVLFSDFSDNDYLTYTIRFENTGNADAINIRVNDMLDNKLDETTLRMVSSTSEYVVERHGSTIDFKFNGIGLPPSVEGTEIGKGQFTYQVKPKTGYAIGDIIENTANIYFDFNAPIVTNTTRTEFVATLAVPMIQNTTFTAFPNPAGNVFNIKMNNNSTISKVLIIDLLGKTVASHNTNSSGAAIDVSHLSKGMYFVKISGSDGEHTVKLLKN